MTPDRVACSGCGIPVPPTDLSVLADARVCPRCYALATPATLAGDPAAARGRSASAQRPRSPVDPADPAGAPDPGGSAARAGALAHGALARLDASVRRWAAGRAWWVRAPVLAWLAWILVRYWDAPWYQTIWKGIDLAVHEVGHILWAPFGPFLAAAGGTLTQLLVPVAAGAVLFRQRDWFGVAVAVSWLGINCFETVEYAGDAVARRLPLVSPTTATPTHDWSYMLGELGLLRHTARVAEAWLWAGRLWMSAGVALGGYVLWRMATTPDREAHGGP